MELGIYIHIPFCIKKCSYCDFISYPSKYEKQEEYINKIIEEIEDNSDIANHINNGTYFRQDLSLYSDDSYLWKANYQDKVEIAPHLYFNYGLDTGKNSNTISDIDIEIK